MGIYANRKSHPNLFMNSHKIQAPNQDYFQTDYMREMLQKNMERNANLEVALKSVKISFQKHRYTADKRWSDITKELRELGESSSEHDYFVTQAREWMKMLENSNRELHEVIQNDFIVKQDLKDEIGQISDSNQEIASKLIAYENMNAELTAKMNELVQLYKTMSEQMGEQSEKQDTVIDNLEKQEAIMEKSYRQLSNLRSILYERTSFITDKMEESFKLTSSVLYKFLTGSDKPLALMLMNQKKDGVKREEE